MPILVDSGCTGSAFIDKSLAHYFKKNQLLKPRPLELADGIAQARITHTNSTTLDLGRHSESIELFITTLSPKHPIILGTPWLRKHDPTIQWSLNILTFSSPYCKTRCLPWKKVLPTALPEVLPTAPSEVLPTTLSTLSLPTTLPEASSNYQPPSFEEVEDHEGEPVDGESPMEISSEDIKTTRTAER